MSKLEWDLKEIFSDNQSFYDEMEHIKNMVAEVRQFKNSKLDSNSLLNILDEKWKIKELSNNVLLYGSLMYYKNVNDNECIELKNAAEKFNNEVNSSLKFIDIKILNLGLEKTSRFIDENLKLETYKLSLHNLFRLQAHIQQDDINEKIKMNNNEINENLNKYNVLLRDIEYGNINVDGEVLKITSSNYAKYISSRDREARRKSYFAVNETFLNEKDRFANLLNSIYEYRIKNANLENYNSVLEKTLFEENIDSKIIKNLIES